MGVYASSLHRLGSWDYPFFFPFSVSIFLILYGLFFFFIIICFRGVGKGTRLHRQH